MFREECTRDTGKTLHLKSRNGKDQQKKLKKDVARRIENKAMSFLVAKVKKAFSFYGKVFQEYHSR